MKFRPLIIVFFLLGLFAYSLLTTGYLLSNQNKATQNVLDSPHLSSFQESLEEQLKSADESANESETAFGDSPISLTNIVFVDALGGVWKTIKTIPIAIWNLISAFFGTFIFPFADFVVVFSIIGAIVIITIIFGVWRLIQSGDSG